ncbi:hypothetical protein HAX54_006038, partial [Datura stramonium]|nr:hypothetical protein [Datura stramonium]
PSALLTSLDIAARLLLSNCGPSRDDRVDSFGGRLTHCRFSSASMQDVGPQSLPASKCRFFLQVLSNAEAIFSEIVTEGIPSRIFTDVL